MTTRRPPPDDVDATALWSSLDTHPRKDRPRPHNNPVTQRAAADVGDAFHLSALPSAWVSELEDSVVDGADLDEHDEDDEDSDASAPTTIMQLPPEMYGARGETSDAHDVTAERDAVDLLKWRAGPPVAAAALPERVSGSRGAANGAASDERSRNRRTAIPLDPQPAGALEIDPMDEVTLGGLAVDAAERLRATLDETMRALMAAQAVADEGVLPDTVVEQLARAVHLLSLAQELSEEM